MRLQLRGPLLGAPVAQFRRDDDTGEITFGPARSMWRAAGPLGSRSSALIVGVQQITVHRTSSDLSGASATSGNWSSAPSGSSCRHLANNSAMSRGPDYRFNKEGLVWHGGRLSSATNAATDFCSRLKVAPGLLIPHSGWSGFATGLRQPPCTNASVYPLPSTSPNSWEP